MNYRAEIDGLRAIAVLPVIFFHAGFGAFTGGYVGVDIFFVISGYLITSILINDISDNKFTLHSFYERRVRRILPALFFISIVCIPFAFAILTPNDLRDFGQSLLAISSFTSNILFWIESGYFETASEFKPMLHTWSLAIEEQFYILFPLFLILFWKKGIKYILVFLFFIFIASLIISHWAAYYRPSANFYLLPTRGWELLIGSFIAFYQKFFQIELKHRSNQWLGIIGFTMILFSVFAFDDQTPFPSLFTLIPTMGTALVIICAVPNTLTNKFMSSKYLVSLGLISYSAYLWHQPIFAFSRYKFLDQIESYHFVFLIFITFLFAFLTWKYIENPFRKNKTISTKMLWRIVPTSLVILISFGFIFHINNGFEFRINYLLDSNTLKQSPMRHKCHSKNNPCQFFGENIEYATFGDSHVVEISYALANYLKEFNVGVQQNSKTSCKPNISEIDSYCYEWSQNAINRIIEDKNIKNVVVSHRLTKYFLEEKNPELIWNDLTEILRIFLQNEKKVYLVIQPPELPQPINRLILHGNKDNQVKIKGMKRTDWESKSKFIYQNIGNLPKEIIVIDPIDFFCNKDYCLGSDLNGYFYTDNNHLSVYGASKIIENNFIH